ncbi:MAG: hypothetical protein ACI90V_003471 [Bacillariaceae sp.]|jgi:hypothetical protein
MIECKTKTKENEEKTKSNNISLEIERCGTELLAVVVVVRIILL